jgi:hypothetical protein
VHLCRLQVVPVVHAEVVVAQLLEQPAKMGRGGAVGGRGRPEAACKGAEKTDWLRGNKGQPKVKVRATEKRKHVRDT